MVISEALSAIRRHEMYTIDKLIDNSNLGIAALNMLKGKREKNKKLEKSVAVKTDKIS